MTNEAAERGSAIVIAIILTAVMMVAALGALQMVDSSQRRSAEERGSETAFNFAEAMLDNELLVTARSWPTTALKALPATCTAATLNCPDAAKVIGVMAGADVSSGASWSTSVRDNIGANATYYSKAAGATTACGLMVPCTWDSNGDGALWIRADATVARHTRSVVALARQQLARIVFPRNTITAEYFKTGNNGNKVIVDEKGCDAKHKPVATCNATDPAPVVVRCTSLTAGTTSDACLGFRDGQVSPAGTTQGLVGNVHPPATLLQMKTYAIQLGTYFTSCPPAAKLTAAMVFIDGASCSYTGNAIINSGTAPGVLVVNAGTISFGGNLDFYGVIYAANNLVPPADAANLVSLSGNAYVQGAVFVDGRGGVLAGSSGLNVSFDPGALANVVAGAPSIALNSFRELLAGM